MYSLLFKVWSSLYRYIILWYCKHALNFQMCLSSFSLAAVCLHTSRSCTYTVHLFQLFAIWRVDGAKLAECYVNHVPHHCCTWWCVLLLVAGYSKCLSHTPTLLNAHWSYTEQCNMLKLLSPTPTSSACRVRLQVYAWLSLTPTHIYKYRHNLQSQRTAVCPAASFLMKVDSFPHSAPNHSWPLINGRYR